MTRSPRLKPPAGGLSRRQAMALLSALGVGAEALAQDRPPPGVKDAVAANPSYRVLLENDRVRVIEYRSRPGRGVCGEGLHWHPAHVTVNLTPARFRYTPEGGQTQTGEVPAGIVLWEEAGAHAAENIGGWNTHLVIVELKGPDWRPSTG